MTKNFLGLAAATLALASLTACSAKSDHAGAVGYSDRTWGDGTYELVDPAEYEGKSDQMPRVDLYAAPAAKGQTCRWHTGVNPLGAHRVSRPERVALADGNAKRIVLDGCKVTASAPVGTGS